VLKWTKDVLSGTGPSNPSFQLQGDRLRLGLKLGCHAYIQQFQDSFSDFNQFHGRTILTQNTNDNVQEAG